jgi:hypothetical protein
VPPLASPVDASANGCEGGEFELLEHVLCDKDIPTTTTA